jgi:tetratricopeptide (TPR) repeat protein
MNIKKIKNILFYFSLLLISLGFILSIYNLKGKGFSFLFGFVGVSLYFIIKTTIDIIMKKINIVNLVLQISIILMSITLFCKYQYFGFWEYPTILIVPMFAFSSALFFIKQQIKISKNSITSILYLILTIPLFAFDIYFDNPPNPYISYQWTDNRENYQITIEQLPVKFEFKQTEELRKIAHNLRSKGDFKQAIKKYREALILEPRNQYLLFDLATCYQSYEDMPQALILMGSAISIDSTHSAFFNNRALIYSSLGKYDMAILDYLKALELNNNQPSIHFNLALIYYDKKKFDLACESIKNAETHGLNLTNEKLIEQAKRVKRKCN